MVNPAIIAAIAASNASMAASRRRAEDMRRQQEAARSRRAAEERRRRDEEERRRRRKRDEEERRRREEEHKKSKLHNYQQKQKENKDLDSSFPPDTYEFTKQLKVTYDDFNVVYEGSYESVLADGSFLSSLDGKYVRAHPNGRVQEYVYEYVDNEKVFTLTREELPNGAMVVYENGNKVYQRDEKGNYTYHKYDKNGKLQEILEGNLDAAESIRLSDYLEIKYDDLAIVHEGAFESVLADGSRLSSISNKYIMTHPNGRMQEFESYGSWEYKKLHLVKDELPNGAVVIYDDSKQKVYERDKDGNYTYHKTDNYDKILTTVEGKVDTAEPTDFSNNLELSINDLEVAYKGVYEKKLPDGSTLSESASIYQVRHLNGRVQEYEYYWSRNSDSKYVLLREELPNGSMAVYDKNGQKIYERDEQGNYTYHKTDENGEKQETIQGKIDLVEPVDFTDKLEINYSDLDIVSKGLSDSLLSDGSRLSEIGGQYEIRHPNGRIQEFEYVYRRGTNDNFLVLKKEELPNGAMVIYEEGKKTYERDKDGNYIACKYTTDGKLETSIKGDANMWKKTLYNENGEAAFYITSNEPNKKYYMSGKLYEEKKENGEVFRYAENGVCLYERDEQGNYKKYQLAANEKDRLLIEKGVKDSWDEKYSYYPSGQVKEEQTGGRWSGNVRKFAENGVCLYETDGRRERLYQLTPDCKGRQLVEVTKYGQVVETHSYYSNGNPKESKYEDGTYVLYREDKTYKKFDKHARLKEETDALGKTTYTHYEGVNMVEHMHRYDINGNDIASEYKHFDKEGKEDTAYYLALKRIVARKIEKADEKQAKKGIPPKERKVSKKMSKSAKLFAHLKAKRISKGK